MSYRTVNSYKAQVIIYSWALILKWDARCGALKTRLAHRQSFINVNCWNLKWPSGTYWAPGKSDQGSRNWSWPHRPELALGHQPASHPWRVPVLPLFHHSYGRDYLSWIPGRGKEHDKAGCWLHFLYFSILNFSISIRKGENGLGIKPEFEYWLCPWLDVCLWAQYLPSLKQARKGAGSAYFAGLEKQWWM